MAGKKKTVTKLVLSPFKLFLYMFLVGFIMMIFVGYSVSIHEVRNFQTLKTIVMAAPLAMQVVEGYLAHLTLKVPSTTKA